MPQGQNPNSEISGVSADSSASDVASPTPSLREVAEAAYDEASTPLETPSAPPSLRDDGRDERGRFVPKSTEAGEAEPKAPSPAKPPETAQKPTEPAPTGSSTRPYEHWSAEDRQAFDAMPEQAKAFFMRRYNEMEADYTRKSQANAGAVQAVQALAPIFNDPVISQSLQEMQYHPVQAIQEWAGFHRRAVGPPQDRAGLLIELAERMGFDPAKLFAAGTTQPPGPVLPANLSEKDKQDPALRYVADVFGRTTSDLQALRNEIQAIRAGENAKAEEEALKVTRWGIDNYADEKGQDGKPLRPHFDRVLPQLLDMFQANPQRDLHEAYETACWANPEVRNELIAAERGKVTAQQQASRAQAAVRGNLRGITAPVGKPSERKGNGTLRDMLEASADEVGF